MSINVRTAFQMRQRLFVVLWVYLVAPNQPQFSLTHFLHPPFFLFVHSLKLLWHISCQPHVKSVYDCDELVVDGETWRFMQQEIGLGLG